jgi:hypothetical protein
MHAAARGPARFLVALSLLVLAAGSVRADEPRLPPPRGFVNDFAGVIPATSTP